MLEKNDDCRCPRAQHFHGTPQCYRTCKCRRPECRKANSDAARHQFKQQVYGRSRGHQIAAHATVKHLRKLARRGWGTHAVAKETGVSTTLINRLVNIDPRKNWGVKTTPTVRADISDKLLAFNPPFAREKFQGTEVELVASIGTHRRLQALAAIGFSLHALAEEAGFSPSYFTKVMSYDNVRLTTAHTVSELYDRMWNKTPPVETKQQRIGVSLTKNNAERNGWLPPMAWDDDGIDDPQYEAVA